MTPEQAKATYTPGTRIRELESGDVGMVTRVEIRREGGPLIWALWDASKREEWTIPTIVEVIS